LLDFQKRFILGLDHDETSDDGPEKVEHSVHVIIGVDTKRLGYFGVGVVQQERRTGQAHDAQRSSLGLDVGREHLADERVRERTCAHRIRQAVEPQHDHRAPRWSSGPLANAYRLKPYTAVSAAKVACKTNINGFRSIQSTRTMCDSVPMFLDTVNNTTAANGFIQ